jgi:hypothetical protein
MEYLRNKPYPKDAIVRCIDLLPFLDNGLKTIIYENIPRKPVEIKEIIIAKKKLFSINLRDIYAAYAPNARNSA